MNIKVTNTQNSFVCSECQNDISVEPKDLSVNDVIECTTCGIEYVVTAKNENEVIVAITQTSK